MESMKMFYRLFSALFKILVYRGYYKKYNLIKSFKFNGYLIRISGDGEITVGENSYISFYSYINVVKGSCLTVGSNVSIAHNVKIYTSSFIASELVSRGVKELYVGNVTIGNNVLIGSNCFICPGVTIGDNVVVGANSVVTKNLSSDAVYGGVPARIIRKVP